MPRLAQVMPDLAQASTSPAEMDALDEEILVLGRRLARRPRSLTGASPYDRLMAQFSASPELRAALFRLVDVAPACAGRGELTEHLAAYLEEVEEPGALVRLGGTATGSRLLAPAAGVAAATAVRQMANRFIVGETIADAVPALRRFWERGVTSTVDLLGEATVTHAEGRAYADRCDRALVELAAATRTWPERPLLERDTAGRLPRANLSVKVTALTPLVRPDAPRRGAADVIDHLRRLLARAAEVGAHLHIDMESMDSRELILGLVLDLLAEPQYAHGPSVGIVLQAYLRDSEDLLDRILERTAAAAREVPLTIRLVKGAYWDHETIEAAQNGWQPPVWTEKAESDRCYERLSRRLVEAFPLVRPAFASHNLRSVAHAVTAARRAGLATEDIEVQVLRGLGDDLQDAVAAAGLRCRTYCPVGDMVAGMAYLVRRLLENTSNASFLAGQAAGADLDQLLRRP
ncbi:MAG: proline dehydrogenase family protein [Actinobacteria bacterium]|nr:proline dehydrogenase family protein [Actinomycetota bacterium]